MGLVTTQGTLDLIIERRRIRIRSVRLLAVLGGVGCLAFVGAGVALAASGDLDRRFSGDGIAKTGFGQGGHGLGFAEAIAVQPNGRMVIAGSTGQPAFDFGLARLRPNGKLDRSFGDGGTVRIDFGGIETAQDVAVQDDGRIVVVGEAPLGDRVVIGIARLRPSGDLDPSFGTGGKEIVDPFEPSAEAWQKLSLALEPSGDILVGGTESVSEPVSPGFVARLEPDGDLDPSFADGGLKTIDLAPGTIGSTYVNQLIIDPRGRIATAVTTVDHSNEPGVGAVMLRLRSNGDYDPSFSGNGWKRMPGINSALLSIAAAPHGRLIGAGRAWDAMLVTRVKDSGAFDRSFAGDGVKRTSFNLRHVVAQRVMLQRNGKPLIAATFEKGFSNHGAVVARLRRNGKLDRSFSGDGKKILRKISPNHPAFTDAAMQANGKILLTGDTGGSSPKAYVARLKNHERPFVAP
jgi:uncharacterized delta-60 repeat protein